MSEVERGEYERVIEGLERDNAGLSEEVMQMRALINGFKEVQRENLGALLGSSRKGAKKSSSVDGDEWEDEVIDNTKGHREVAGM